MTNRLQLKKIECLDLGINDSHTYKILTVEGSHSCYFNSDHKHILHSNNAHLNSLTDLIISLGNKLEKQETKNNNIWNSLIEVLKEKNKVIRQLTENLDYIKEQNKTLITKHKNLEQFRDLDNFYIETKQKLISIERYVRGE